MTATIVTVAQPQDNPEVDENKDGNKTNDQNWVEQTMKDGSVRPLNRAGEWLLLWESDADCIGTIFLNPGDLL